MIDFRNLLLISAVLIFVGIVGFWIPYEKSKNAPLPTDAQGNAEVEVTYDADGFHPATLTVSVGTTVAWKNVSGLPMWVASDPHPSHTDLKGFDQLRIINRAIPTFIRTAHAHGSAIYEYTFTEVGTWKYHNHVNPQHRGMVVVTEK